MLTRCPHCQTAFRVTPEQLKVHHGVVRCGTCREVFNALDSLTDEVAVVITQQQSAVEAFQPTAGLPLAEADITVEPEPELDPEPVSESAVEPELAPETGPELVPELEPELEPETQHEREAEVLPDVAPGIDEASVAVAVTTLSVPVTVETEEVVLPAAWASVDNMAPPRRWPWLVGVLALLILMLGQLLFVFRVELAVLLPELRPALMTACDLAGCALPHPRKLESLSIETSDLAPADGERLLLTATLKNRAPFDQEYPYLELTLTDTRDAAMVRKVLTPADYLPVGQPAGGSFAARSEIAVKLKLEALGVPAVGYRLYLFYP